jgi:hypothetical protein
MGGKNSTIQESGKSLMVNSSPTLQVTISNGIQIGFFFVSI